MATITAQFLIGDSHIYHDGIIPTHFLFLSENDKPHLILVCQNLSKNPDMKKIVWIPTVENMLKDALLMVSTFIVKDPEILELMNHDLINTSPLQLYTYFTKDHLEILYNKMGEIQKWPKIVITILNDSSLTSQIDEINNYPISHELCLSNHISVQ